MQLPIGILIYWVKRFEENHAVISGMWYYKGIYVPSSPEEKKVLITDLKNKRCTVINIHGTYDQIKDILSQGDKYIEAGSREVSDFYGLPADIEKLPEDKAYLFDDIYNVKGTALMVDTAIDVDETLDGIKENIRKGKVVDVFISEGWSFSADVLKAIGKTMNAQIRSC